MWLLLVRIIGLLAKRLWCFQLGRAGIDFRGLKFCFSLKGKTIFWTFGVVTHQR